MTVESNHTPTQTPEVGSPRLETRGAEQGADVAIVALYSSGRWDEACSLLYQIYWQSILAITTRRLRGWLDHGALGEASEDVAMQAVHRVHTSLRRKAEEGSLSEIITLRAWIRRVIQRQVYDTLKRRAGRAERLTGTGELEHEPGPEAEVMSETKVIDLMEGSHRLRDLRGCVEAVESRPGQALRLWLGGMTYLAVARELAYASLSSAQSAVQAGIAKVSRCMQGKGWVG